MANYVYTIGINADTKQAEAQIRKLNSSLQSIKDAAQTNITLDLKLDQAAKSAHNLQSALASAVNVDTGKLNLSAFNQSLKGAGTSLKEVASNLTNLGPQGAKAFSQLATSVASAEVPLKKTNSTLKAWGTTLKNTLKWEISSSIIHGIEGFFKGAISYAKELNGTLSDIRIVTGASIEDMTKFTKQANTMAKELSATTQDIAKASLIYYQQGDSSELAAKKAAITTKAANIAFTASAQEMSQMLTAVWNSYQVGEDQLEHVVDVLANLGATTASSMEEMAQGMQKVAATANTVGVSMEQMSAIVATSASVTRQAPQVIGTAWNTILSRLGGLKLGETLEDGVDLNKYSKALATVGVDVLDATGELRNMGDVVNELGEKWQTLSTAQKSAVSQTIGGVRQYTQLMAFFENFDKYQENLNTANNSSGTLNKQAAIYAESWEAASKRQKAALQGVFSEVINDQAIIKFTNSLTSVIEKIGQMIQGFGGIGGVLSTLGNIGMSVFSDQIGRGIENTVQKTTNFFGKIKEAKEISGASYTTADGKGSRVGYDEATGLGSQRSTRFGRFIETFHQLGSAETRETRAQLQEAQSAFASVKDSNTNPANQVAIASAQKLLNLKQQLLNVQNRLGPAGAQAAQQEIDALSLQHEKLTELVGQYEDLEYKQKTITSQNAETLYNQTQAKGGIKPAQSEYEKQLESITKNTAILDYAHNRHLGQSDYEKTLEGLKSDPAELMKQAQSYMYSANSSVGGLQTLGVDTSAIEASMQKINEIMSGENVDTEALAQELGKLNQAFIDTATGAAAARKNSEDWVKNNTKGVDQNTVNNAVNTAKDQGLERSYMANQVGNQGRNVKEQEKKTEDSLKDDKKISKVAGALKTVASAAMSARAGFNAASSAYKTFADQSSSNTQKVSAGINVMTNLVSSWSQGIVSGIIGTVATGAGLLISWIDAANKEAEAKRKLQAEKAQKQTEELKKKIENDQKAIKTFEEVQKGFENHEFGADEYISKLEEVAESLDIEGAHVMALTGNYQALEDAIKNASAERLTQAIEESDAAMDSARRGQVGAFEQVAKKDESYSDSGMSHFNYERNGGGQGTGFYSNNFFWRLQDQGGANGGGMKNEGLMSTVFQGKQSAEVDAVLEKYGVSGISDRTQRAYALIAAMTGLTRRGSSGSWGDDLFISQDVEKQVELYEKLTHLQEIASNDANATAEQRIAYEIVNTAQVNDVYQMLAQSTETYRTARDLGFSSRGQQVLNAYKDDEGFAAAYASGEKTRDALINEVIAAWGETPESISAEGKALAEKMVDAFLADIPAVAEQAAKDQQMSEAVKSVVKVANGRLGVSMESSEDNITQALNNAVEDGQITQEQLLNASPYDLDYSSPEALIASVQSSGDYHLADSRAKLAKRMLESPDQRTSAIFDLLDEGQIESLGLKDKDGKIITTASAARAYYDETEDAVEAHAIMEKATAMLRDNYEGLEQTRADAASRIMENREATTTSLLQTGETTLAGTPYAITPEMLEGKDWGTVVGGQMEKYLRESKAFNRMFEEAGANKNTWAQDRTFTEPEKAALKVAARSIFDSHPEDNGDNRFERGGWFTTSDDEATLWSAEHGTAYIGSTLNSQYVDYGMLGQLDDTQLAEMGIIRYRRATQNSEGEWTDSGGYAYQAKWSPDRQAETLDRLIEGGYITQSGYTMMAKSQPTVYDSSIRSQVSTAETQLEGMQAISAESTEAKTLADIKPDPQAVKTLQTLASIELDPTKWDLTDKDQVADLFTAFGFQNEQELLDFMQLSEQKRQEKQYERMKELNAEIQSSADYTPEEKRQSQLQTDAAFQSLATTDYDAAWTRQQALLEESSKALTKQQTGLSTMISHIKDGKLNATEAQALNAAGFSIDATKFQAAATEAERIQLASQATTEYIKSGYLYQEQANQSYDDATTYLGKINDKFGEGEDKIKDEKGHFKGLNDIIRSEFADASDEVKGLVASAYKDMIADGYDVSQMTGTEVIAELTRRLSEAKQTNIDNFAEIKAAAEASLTGIYANMTTEAQAEAEKQLQIWQTMFNKVAELRKKAISGDDISGDLLTDFNTFNSAFMASGYEDADAFMDAARNGKLTPDTFALPEWNAEEQRKAFGLDQESGLIVTDSEGKVTGIQTAKEWTTAKKEQIASEAYAASMDAWLAGEGAEFKDADEGTKAAKYAEYMSQEGRQDAYNTELAARQAAVDTDLEGKTKALVSSTYGDMLSDETQGSIVAAYMHGDNDTKFKIGGQEYTAQEIMNMAATSTYKNLDLFHGQQVKNQKLIEAQSTANEKLSDLDTEYNTKKVRADNLSDYHTAAYAMATRDITSGQTTQEIIGDVDPTKLLEEVNSVMGTAYKSLEEIDPEQWPLIAKSIDSEYATAMSDLGDVQSARVDALTTLRKTLLDEGFEEDSDTIKALDQKIAEARDTAETAVAAGVEASNLVDPHYLDSFVEQTNLARDEFLSLRDMLQQSTGLDISNPENLDYLNNLTVATARYNEGLAELQDISSDTWKTMNKDIAAGTAAGNKSINDLRKSMAKTFNTDMSKITSTFVQDHLAELEKMSTGTDEEVRAAEETIQDDLVAEVIKADKALKDHPLEVDIDADGTIDKFTGVTDFFQNAFDQWDGKELGFTIKADTEGAQANVIAAMNSMLASGMMTANGITNALKAIGWEPKITYQEMTLGKAVQSGVTGSIHYQLPDGTWAEGTMEGLSNASADTKVKVPTIQSVTKTGGGGGGSGGGGGGGGGGNNKSISKLKTDKPERYHRISKTQEKYSNILSSIQTKKDGLFGEKYLKQINEEIKAYKDLIDINKGYYNEVLNNYNKYKEILENTYGFNIVDGVIQNYNEIFEKEKEAYNATQEWWNSLTADEQQDAGNRAKHDAATARWEEFKTMMEEFESDVALMDELREAMQEYANQLSALEAESIKTKIEIKWDIDERELDRLDRWINRYDDRLETQDKSLAKLIEKMRIYTGTADEFKKKIGVGEKDKNDVVQQFGQFEFGGELGELYKRLQEAKKLHDQYLKNPLTGMNDSDYADVLKEIAEKWDETLENIDKVRDSLKDVYENTLKLAESDISHYSKHFDHIHTMLADSIELQQLLGRGQNYEDLKTFYDGQVAASTESLRNKTAWVASLKEQKANMQSLYESATTEEEKAMYLDEIKKLDEKIDEAEQDRMAAWKQNLEDIKAQFENSIDATIAQLKKDCVTIAGIASDSIHDFDDLKDEYDYYTESQERYLSTAKELYEVSKLNRKINDSVSKSTTAASKARLKALQDEINAKSKSNQLTEYDVKLMDLKYQHALALQELEDAQNSKSIVRLTRDENGNYGYQYTVDDSKISEAQQKVEDTLQEQNELIASRTAELEKSYIDTENAFYEKIAEISKDTTLTYEERQEKLARAYEQYTEKMGYIQEQYATATNDLTENQNEVQKRYGTTILENTGKLQDQANAMIGLAISSNSDYSALLKKALEEGGSIWSAFNTAQTGTQTANEAAGDSWDNLKDHVSDYNTELKNTSTELGKVRDTFKTVTDSMTASFSQWNSFAAILSSIINNAEGVSSAVAAAIQQLAGNTDTETGDGTEGSGNITKKTKYAYTWSYDGAYGKFSGANSGYESELSAKKAAKSDIEAQLKQLISQDKDKNDNTSEIEAIISAVAQTIQISKFTTVINNDTNESYNAYKRGGLIDYTGPAWVDGTYSEPELVLNSADTQNMLQAIELMHELSSQSFAHLIDTLYTSAMSMASGFSTMHAGYIDAYKEQLDQNVTIHAEFPNVTEKSEIVDAFDDLINLATQYANRK